ncbi:MAG: glycerophosphodiester phosphodiesterase family protein [Pseudomonadota bacterium]
MTLRPQTRTVPSWLTQWEYAHRSLHSVGIPENSLEAAKLAVKAGLGIECDIQLSLDSKAMVFHDWELDRLTGKSGFTDEFTRSELEKLPLQATNHTIPSFSTFLNEVAAAVPILIEIKSKPGYAVEQTCERVAEELKAYSGDCAVMSFDPRTPQWFRKNAPETVCGLVMREDEFGHTQTAKQREAALMQAEPDFLAYHIAALPNPWVRSLRDCGLPILTWTVNSSQEREIALEHADALIAEGEGLE